MSHTSIDDLAAQVAIQPGAIVSKVIHHGDGLDVTVFAIDTAQGLSPSTGRHSTPARVSGCTWPRVRRTPSRRPRRR